jgi:hypothetical protein
MTTRNIDMNIWNAADDNGNVKGRGIPAGKDIIKW